MSFLKSLSYFKSVFKYFFGLLTYSSHILNPQKSVLSSKLEATSFWPSRTALATFWDAIRRLTLPNLQVILERAKILRLMKWLPFSRWAKIGFSRLFVQFFDGDSVLISDEAWDFGGFALCNFLLIVRLIFSKTSNQKWLTAHLWILPAPFHAQLRFVCVHFRSRLTCNLNQNANGCKAV